jgi:hypothetical protein
MSTPSSAVKVSGPLNLGSGQVLSQNFQLGSSQATLIIHGPLVLGNGKSISASLNLIPPVISVGFRDVMGITL